jgi:hypothetical protein
MARKVALAAFLCGFAVGLSRCGPTTAEPPYLLIRVVQQSGFSGGSIHGYVFTVSRDGFDVLGDLHKPEAPSPTPLTNSETLRVVFPADYSGRRVEVAVYALDKSGEIIGFGKRDAVVTAGAEVVLEVGVRDLIKPDGGGPVFDAGVITACACDGGCCRPDGGCSTPYQYPLIPDAGVFLSVAYCGTNGFTCSALCTVPYANVCRNGSCGCGVGPPCAVGEWCLSQGGNSRCVCSPLTGCAGCCDGQERCQRGDQTLSCGRGGNPCKACTGDGTLAAACKTANTGERNYGFCITNAIGCLDPLKCVSGPDCTLVGPFPRCRSKSTPPVCLSCDAFRADRCNADFTDGCACGDAGTCAPSQFCDKGVCRQVPLEL